MEAFAVNFHFWQKWQWKRRHGMRNSSCIKLPLTCLLSYHQMYVSGVANVYFTSVLVFEGQKAN
ncbi:hypothetical protein D4L84_09095 [Campylobacter coli]|nr:hypothetical protein D4L84_09095 [Campylobacter coli]